MTRPRAAFAAALALMSSVPPAGAEDFRLSVPLHCEMGKTCFIEDYVDNDPTQGRHRDFACGINSRDGHKGTDFALLDFGVIQSGVSVLASAPGVVKRIRDSMPDDRLMRGVTAQNACGNAVLIDHGEGWQTLYCHLRLGSVAVAPGDLVQTGDPLGLVGLSGQTNHPHVHLTVLRNGQVVDPFRPEATGTCGDPGPTLWTDPPTYVKTGLITAGFSDGVPTLAAVSDGSARRLGLTPDQPMVLYAHAGYAQPGDVLTLTAHSPAGTEVFRRAITLDRDQISQMRAFGRKAPSTGWPLGEYLGRSKLTRDGTVIAHRFAHVTVAE
ncbi:M23 family metallopeptidase [Mameliella sediminis]|uniref:M23 family metallopeptidase n=1 Tax=Mameliella sediminis TaxID=2836866 RepID=UPI001C48016D|nr:M23 family metallopeptidase [Mameliella sediminis]MBV7394749.1 M23 family metallopeptidase [Mameliella sediminis]MBY6163198.1 M23 family metallopeptidase [Mameliella alba]MBY6171462.1 M23 family metallopeptidase [Mameliella alba]MBY6176686.1 M23 family metallopeptidase [Mameliella alba]